MENYPVPLILKCTVTGQEVKYYSRPYIEQRIARAGDLATLVNTFMVKGAKKKKQATYTPAKTWKGQDIIKSDKPAESATPLANNNVGEKIFNYPDGTHCRVSYTC